MVWMSAISAWVPRSVLGNVMPQGPPPEDATIDLDVLLGDLQLRHRVVGECDG